MYNVRNRTTRHLDSETKKRYITLQSSFQNLSQYCKQISHIYDNAITNEKKLKPTIYVLEHVPATLAHAFQLGNQVLMLLAEHGIDADKANHDDSIEILVE